MASSSCKDQDQDHHPQQSPSSSSRLAASARVWLTLLLLVSHHCSTTWSAAVAAREEHRRWMTMADFASFGATEAPSPAPEAFTTSKAEPTSTNSTFPLANSTATTSSSAPMDHHQQTPPPPTPEQMLIAPGVQAQHASGELSLEPSANHQVTLEAQNSILSAAEAVSLDLTHRIISPIVWVNNRVSQAAGTLPALMAANGALLGTAIAVPIQSTALAANHLAAAGAGTLVTSAREFYHSSLRPTLHTAYQTLVPASPLPVLVRPAAVLGGAGSVVGGMALGVVSSSVHSVAEGVQSLGGQLAGAGEGIAQWGDALVLWSAAEGEPEAEAQEALEPKKPEDQEEAEKETKKPEDQVPQQQQQQ
ncbi:hypothetical protein TYRP_010327 [Tyrophagus putrescentiae]|nr:hypothetical protein TYRP_010327 [Tyrophagus putrescentiae]